MKSRLATFLVSVIGEAQRVFGNAVGERRIRAAPEWPASEDKLVGTDTKRPPVNGVSVSALVKYFRCHIGHRSGYTSEHPTVRIMDGDVKVGEMSMAALIK